jgi:hypothetical protein
MTSQPETKSKSIDLPNNERLVLLEEHGGEIHHVGWYSHSARKWFALSRESLQGEELPKGIFCSLSIVNITGWREIDGSKSDLPRPSTRGELVKLLKEGQSCEVVSTHAEMTNVMLLGWLGHRDFMVSDSPNYGWTIYTPITRSKE